MRIPEHVCKKIKEEIEAVMWSKLYNPANPATISEMENQIKLVFINNGFPQINFQLDLDGDRGSITISPATEKDIKYFELFFYEA